MQVNIQVKTSGDTSDDLIKSVKDTLERHKVPSYVLEWLGVMSDKLFSHVVNSNLEVRTSVAINPATGAAEERALHLPQAFYHEHFFTH